MASFPVTQPPLRIPGMSRHYHQAPPSRLATGSALLHLPDQQQGPLIARVNPDSVASSAQSVSPSYAGAISASHYSAGHVLDHPPRSLVHARSMPRARKGSLAHTTPTPERQRKPNAGLTAANVAASTSGPRARVVSATSPTVSSPGLPALNS